MKSAWFARLYQTPEVFFLLFSSQSSLTPPINVPKILNCPLVYAGFDCKAPPVKRSQHLLRAYVEAVWHLLSTMLRHVEKSLISFKVCLNIFSTFLLLMKKRSQVEILRKKIQSSPTGIEPMTFQVPVGCSTTELWRTHCGEQGHTTRENFFSEYFDLRALLH